MVASRNKRTHRDPTKERLEAILERALSAYQGDELHGGARRVRERILDTELVPIAREAFRDADDLPADPDVLHVLDSEPMQFLGEGYHVIALVEPGRRFAVKYAKHPTPVPPLAPPPASTEHDWERDHGVRPDGSLHPAIWQHIRAFEAYGPLAVPSRVYIADTTLESMADGERRALERFRSIGIVRSLGRTPRPLSVHYPEDFPPEKRARGGLAVSVVVVQPFVTPIAVAIEQALRAGDVGTARDLEARYEDFTQQLWRCGVSHLDFSMLNIGLVGDGPTERLQLFDPHIGVIDVADGERQVKDPLWAHQPEDTSVEDILRSSRDGSRWALWRVQQDVAASEDVPPEGADGATTLLREFHEASEGLEDGGGSFGVERFDQEWQQRRTHTINTVMHAQLWALVRHPLGEMIRSMLEPLAPDSVYDRTIAVLGLHDDRQLPQFRAALKVFQDHPLILITNVSDETSGRVKHWGRVPLPLELDVQEDPAIHYHLRDLFTGEVYVCPGDDLARRGLMIGLAPLGLHAFQVEDVRVTDIAVERTLAAHRDISEFLPDCTKRVGVVGDVHGELQAFKEILRALSFIDVFDHWSARDGTLVLTGDVGHGRHLQEVFDFIHRLATQAHRLGGRIVWTLGNHDLYADREGGQGGTDSLGYRLWPAIREAALHPERHPGLRVQAAYCEYGKLFVHGGVLPNVVELTMRERGHHDAETVASYVNDVLRRTLVERERISARDLPHDIFHIGTSHTEERRMPGDIGYEPAGVFTPDLRELDHYRYHADLLPQVVGHTASQRGEIRYAPGSWFERDYIAIDVGRQHGTGNGGLLLTDFGWVAVTPAGPARLVEVTPLFADLARKALRSAPRSEYGEEHVSGILSSYFQVTRPKRGTPAEIQEALFADLSPPQVVALDRLLATTRETRRCAVVSDLDEMLTAFSGGALGDDTLRVIVDYLAAGGVLVFCTDTDFDWLYARLLRPLIVELGPRSPLLARAPLVLSGGTRTFAFHHGAYQLISRQIDRDRARGFDALVELSKTFPGMPPIDPEGTAYVADSMAPARIDHALTSRVGLVVDVGDALVDASGKPLAGLQRDFHRAIDVLVAATAAMREGGSAALSTGPPDVGDTVLWTFDRPDVPPGRRLRVRVSGSGFVHAGVSGAGGVWSPVYNVPLAPLPEGGYEAVLPPGVDAFTFFWTEAPWAPGRPGHWEHGRSGPRVFRADAKQRDARDRAHHVLPGSNRKG